ncbi:MAG TPA: DUF1254 domain-containing protein, partial [Chitinophagaceae bacterium]|nr:DUF1254 domain-containing protein [Chitinophagaceae bacterium]
MKKINLNSMLRSTKYLALSVAIANASVGYGQDSEAEMKKISTPDKVASKFGELKFKDGMPDAATTQKLYDELDYHHALNAYMNGLAAVNQLALRKGHHKAGIMDNEVLISPEFMDFKGMFLTANADTYYMWTYLDLSKGPLVVEPAPNTLGIFNDMWWKWISDAGLAGPDRGEEGSKFLVLPPGYKGAVPEGGYYICRSNTWQCSFLSRAFLQSDNDPKTLTDMVKKTLKIYPYVPGGVGSSVASYLSGQGTLGQLSKPVSPKFIDATGKVINTVPPNDFSYFEMLNEVIQAQPVESADPEILGQCAAIGIVKGKPFNPDARMKKIMTDAVTVGSATLRAVSFNGRSSEEFYYYDNNSTWFNPLFVGGYSWNVPPPEITKDGVKAAFDDGANKINARNSFFYWVTGITPAMCMRLENIGSQYVAAAKDINGNYLDGGKTYKVVLPANIPAARFWSFTVYDNQT